MLMLGPADMQSSTGIITLPEYEDEFIRHPLGGGLVSITADVHWSAFVAPGAIVRGRAVLEHSARLFHQSMVEDDARIGSMVTLRDNARVGGSSVVKGGAVLRDDVYIGGASEIAGSMIIEGRARLIDQHLRGRLTIR